jgi:alanine racemase
MLYGADPLDAANDHSRQLRPAMSLLSEVIAMRDVPEGDSVGYGAAWVAERPSRIATVAIGYADGYPRSAASGTPVLVAGQLCPLVGRVSMDMICVDVTDTPQVVIGSDVELWGQQLSIDVVADHANTIAYELTARMPMRTPRVYRSHSE